MVNDHLPYSIISGLVTVKGNIREFTKNGVVFEDGEEEEVDAVVFCTGYNIKFPYLDESIIKVKVLMNCIIALFLTSSAIERNTCLFDIIYKLKKTNN